MARHGRPAIIDFPCPECGAPRLVCRCTRRQGSLLARYYKCRACGHRGVLVKGAGKTWWKDSHRAGPDACS